MTDHDASPPANLRPRRPLRHSAHHDTDTIDHNSLSTVPPNFTAAPSGTELPGQTPSQTPSNIDNRHAEKRFSAGAHRAQKHRSSGGFLLADSLFNRHGNTRPRHAQTHSNSDKRHHKSIEHQARHGEQRSQSRSSSSSTPRPSSDLGYGPRPGTHPEDTSNAVAKQDSLAGDTAVGSSPRTSTAQLDMESAQIVNMALNLSESRRLASRRNVSQPTPPRLAPLPDGAPGGSLRYHLQQQRKISRTVSPKPDRSPRLGTPRVLSPLQSAFESGGSYRYHFSQSTLARAQKAKEYLELMAQYRRVLELLGPLETERTTRPWTASPSGTPNGSAVVFRISSGEPEVKIGRPYDPLQYIRNRKVRARERKAIDGEAQGFNDVIKVSEWIDGVAKWVATGQARISGNALPPFSGAQPDALEASPPSANARTTVAKPKRPRVDWVIDPADMIADVYWLELDDNKKLVEDRHWRRVFPQGPDFPRPMSSDEPRPRLTTPGSTKDWSDSHTAEKATPEPPSSRHEQEHTLSTARDRAQQKLRALKGAHHRHASSITNRDLLRLHRGSLSESSDTDSDRRRRARGSVPAGNVRSILEMQIEEMIAREQENVESHPLYDHEALRMKFTPITPEREPPHASADASNPTNHRRTGSRAELSETESKVRGWKQSSMPRLPPPQPAGRASLEVPNPRRRFSVDDDTSQPNSPDLRPARDWGAVPALGMDLSPMSSRQGSPHRNPLTKVKSIFRERSKERGNGAVSLNSPPDAWLGAPEAAESGVSSPQRKPSRSPIGERLMGHRSHKSINNGRLRGEDGGISLRSFFRGPRIDTVLRSGVSKVGDLIWRKEAGEDSSSTSSSDSEAEARGRSRGPRGLRRGNNLAQDGKGMLEAPHFVSVKDHAKSDGQLVQHPPAKPLSRRSSRFDLLKPPRIDIENASPSTSPPPPLVGRQRDPVGSDTESPGGRGDARAAAAGSLDAALTIPQPSPTPSTRHWSITDYSGPPARSTLSKRELARLRALLLSSGIHAMEMSRRAHQRKLLPPTTTTTTSLPPPCPLPQTHIYPLTARTLATSINTSTTNLHTLASHFTTTTAPSLTNRVESLRYKVAGSLTSLAQDAADAADEANYDLVVAQRLKVKRVVDVMETMLRRRRRRFRWVRRAGWLVVEWVLIGCMWYVWFVVMIVRVVLGVVGGVGRGVRWLLRL